VKVLGDAALASRLQILLELRRRPAATLAPLARTVDLTPQAVSQHLKSLEREGLVRRQDHLLRITPAGEEFLRSQLSDLKEWTDAAVRELVVIRSTVAIAKAALRAGDRVGLFMEDGRLVAYPDKRSPSSGVASADAPPGKDVLVSELQGVVEIPVASLHVVEAASGDDGGWLDREAGEIAAARWAALDEVGEAMLRRLGKPATLEFAPFETAVRAVQRGVPVAYLGSREAVGRLVAQLEASKAEGKLSSFDYQVHRNPRAASREAKRRRA
jgi:predicted transcriptional regulator